jgi:hypothetical protein
MHETSILVGQLVTYPVHKQSRVLDGSFLNLVIHAATESSSEMSPDHRLSLVGTSPGSMQSTAMFSFAALSSIPIVTLSELSAVLGTR